MIYYEKRKKRKPKKPDAVARALQADWERVKAAHQAPLDKGAKAKSVKIKAAPKVPVLFLPPVQATPIPMKALPVPITDRSVGTKPAHDQLAQAKASMRSRLGQSYNKGGLQYLTDDEIAEQRTGAHMRR